jgi:UDP-glucose 4-epimerase
LGPILVTGGAGYIGSHVIKELIDSGRQEIVVIDNLSSGLESAVVPPAQLIVADLSDQAALSEIFKRYLPEVVFHFAALTNVAESLIQPQKYYLNNLAYGFNLLSAAERYSSKQVIFSSSAAVYGEAGEIPLTEESPVVPISPYGRSKAFFEGILRDYDRAYGIRSVSLRYFNAAGADTEGRLGGDYSNKEDLVSVLIKTALGSTAGAHDKFVIYGTDYDTRDGSCIRDLIHVTDLARAHVRALDYLEKGGASGVFNLGSESGCSVKEAVAVTKKVTGVDFPVEEGPRRPGDIDVSIASSEKARRILGWEKQHSSIEEIIRTAWDWARRGEDGD